MTWTLTRNEPELRQETHITFSTDAPALFSLIVDERGNVVLFGYTQPVADDSEPMLAFDTDGSFYLAPEVLVHHHEQVGDDNQPTGFYRTDLEGQGPWATASEAAAAR